MAVIGPAAEGIGPDPVGSLGTRRHIHCMFAEMEGPVVVLDIAPHPVKVNGMGHHGVVNENDPQSFTILENDRVGAGELQAIERPCEPLHMPGQMKFNGAARLSAVRIIEEAFQIRVCENLSTIIPEADAGIVKT